MMSPHSEPHQPPSPVDGLSTSPARGGGGTLRRISIDLLAAETLPPTRHASAGSFSSGASQLLMYNLSSEITKAPAQAPQASAVGSSLRNLRATATARGGLRGSGGGVGPSKPGMIQRHQTSPGCLQGSSSDLNSAPAVVGRAHNKSLLSARRNGSHLRRGSALRMAPSQTSRGSGSSSASASSSLSFLGSLGNTLRSRRRAARGTARDSLNSSTGTEEEEDVVAPDGLVNGINSGKSGQSAAAAGAWARSESGTPSTGISAAVSVVTPSPTTRLGHGSSFVEPSKEGEEAGTNDGQSRDKNGGNFPAGKNNHRGSAEGRGFRHEALEELASNVRDMRAEVHGRPSLSERRFTCLRRSRSCGSLMTELGAMKGVLEGLVEEEEQTPSQGGAASDMAGNSRPRRGTGLRRGSSRKSVLFVDRGRVRASQTGPLLAAAAMAARGNLNLNGSHQSLFSEGTVSRGDFSRLSPQSAAVASIESVYSLVSALYGLSDSLSVGPAVADAILDLTHSVDLAFGRVKSIISTLALESDFDGSSGPGNFHGSAGGGLDATDHTAMTNYDEADEDTKSLIRSVAGLSTLLDAMSEAVRAITDDPANGDMMSAAAACVPTTLATVTSGQDYNPPAPGRAKSWQQQGKMNPEHYCAYVTLLELLGMKCDEVLSSDYVDDVLGGGGGGDDYAAFLGGGGATGGNAANGGGGSGIDSYSDLIGESGHGHFHDSMHSSLSSAEGGERRRVSLSIDDLGSSGRDHLLRDSGEVWQLNRCVRSAWENAGHIDKVVALERHRPQQCGDVPSEGVNLGLKDLHRRRESAVIAKGGELNVDPDLFRELSGMVLKGMEWNPEAVDAIVAGLDDRHGRGTASRKHRRKGGIMLRKIRRGKCTDLQAAMTLCRLGDIRTSLWEHGEALAHYEEALRISRIQQGNRGPLVAGILEAMGNARRLMGHFDQSDSYFHEALSALKQSRNNASAAEGLLSLLLSWSRLRADSGEKHEAIVTLGRRLELLREVYGPDHPDLGDTLFQRGSLQMDIGCDVAAEEDFDESLRIRKATMGPDDESVGDVLFNKGLLRCTSKDQEGALEFLWDSLRIRRHHGSDRLKEADNLAVIGNIHRTMRQNETAVKMYTECLELRMEFLGKEDGKVGDVHAALGYAYTDRQRHREAARHFRSALLITEKRRGDKDARVAHLLRYLGKAEFDAGNPLQAKMYLERYLRLQREAGEDMSVDYVEAMHVLGKISSKMGDRDGSRSTLVEAQRIYATNNHASRRMTVGKELLASLRDITASDVDLFEVDSDNDEESNVDEVPTNSIRSFFQGMQRSMNIEHVQSSNSKMVVAKEVQRTRRIKNAKLAKLDSCNAPAFGQRLCRGRRVSIPVMPGEHLWGSTEINMDPCAFISEGLEDEEESVSDDEMAVHNGPPDAPQPQASSVQSIKRSFVERIVAACNAEVGE